jgi:hypothetical protein
MPVDLGKLVPEFRAKLDTLLANCEARGYPMRPYYAIRTPQEQAALWKQSRTPEEAAAEVARLRATGAPFLAACIEQSNPPHGNPVTNAIPGMSWHQWGEAIDCFWLVDGKAEWSTKRLVNGQNGYRVYAEEAVRLGLNAGGLWTSFKDWPHVQLRAAGSPKGQFTLAQIDERMRRDFGA